MTLGNMYDILEVLEIHLHTALDHCLRGAAKTDGHQWRDLSIEDIPVYLDRIKSLPQMNLGSWRQRSKALKCLVMSAVENEVITLPATWSIETNALGRRFLTSLLWVGQRAVPGKGANTGQVCYQTKAGYARNRLVERLRTTTMDSEVRHKLVKEIRSLSDDEILRRDKEWREIREAQHQLHQCRELLRGKISPTACKYSTRELQLRRKFAKQ